MSKNKKLKKYYKNKRVLITGHTGFVGSWLAFLMIKLKCDVYGISKNKQINSENYKILNISKNLKKEFFLDIEDFKNINKKINLIKPNIIFHLAAQSYVLEGYKNPIDTLKTNIIGTANILKSAIKNKIKYNVIVTTDKCYSNLDKKKTFNENSQLGGNDPYSVSKACAELVSSAFSKSFKSKVYIDTVRAGNIIGGGDFGNNRLIPDIFLSKINKKNLIIRYPKAIRPWQNVLDVIIGYCLIPMSQKNRKKKFDCWNLGPKLNENKINVLQLVKKFLHNFDKNKKIIIRKSNIREAKILMLNSNKIRKKLNWNNIFDINETLKQTSEWYKIYYSGKRNNVKNYSSKLLDDLLKII
tara:strand:- start:83 stop:1150 length:1068 start_codon:yes stop_codon:yes gene_type:complete